MTTHVATASGRSAWMRSRAGARTVGIVSTLAVVAIVELLIAAGIVNAFIVPKNVQNTGFAAVDAAIAASQRADNNHTLNGHDWNNVAPRLGFAWTPTERWVVRGGYGIFYDRPSGAFMNTLFRH